MEDVTYREINMSEASHGGKGDRSRVKDTKNFNSNFDRIFKTQLKGVIDEQEDKRSTRLAEVGLSKYIPKNKSVDSSDT